MKQTTKPMNEKKEHTETFRMSFEAMDELQRAAKVAGVTTSEYIRICLRLMPTACDMISKADGIFSMIETSRVPIPGAVASEIRTWKDRDEDEGDVTMLDMVDRVVGEVSYEWSYELPEKWIEL